MDLVRAAIGLEGATDLLEGLVMVGAGMPASLFERRKMGWMLALTREVLDGAFEVVCVVTLGTGTDVSISTLGTAGCTTLGTTGVSTLGTTGVSTLGTTGVSTLGTCCAVVELVMVAVVALTRLERSRSCSSEAS